MNKPASILDESEKTIGSVPFIFDKVGSKVDFLCKSIFIYGNCKAQTEENEEIQQNDPYA